MSTHAPLDAEQLLARLRQLHDAMRDHLRAYARTATLEEMARETAQQGGDTIYALDDRGEEILLPWCEELGRESPFLLVAEGVVSDTIAGEGRSEGRRLFGCDSIEDARFILICDPIDGTRPLMYDKRSAWLLTGIAPNLGKETNVSHMEIAMQTELATSRGGFSDSLWAVKDQGAHGATFNLMTRDARPFTPRPSRANTIEGGFAMFSKFFPGSKGWLANLEEELLLRVLGAPHDAQPQTFDDQYISTGGQLYELMTGRDRFNADLRPFAHARLHGDHSLRMCCHPYDICTQLIARECGVIVTDEHGNELSAPLDVHSPVTWIGYANSDIQQQIEPVLLELLQREANASTTYSTP